MVERFNKTLKTRMWKYFSEKETRVWLNILPEFVHGYDHAHHSSVGMTPIEAREETIQTLCGLIFMVFILRNNSNPQNVELANLLEFLSIKKRLVMAIFQHLLKKFFK
jgi:hypothetical protein